MTSPAADYLLALNVASIDGSWYRGMTGFTQHTPWLQPLMTAYTTAGILVLCAFLALAWWNARRRADLAAITAITWAGTGTVICVAAALAAGIWLASRRLGMIAAVLALVEGFSRAYLGQHYTTSWPPWSWRSSLSSADGCWPAGPSRTCSVCSPAARSGPFSPAPAEPP